MIKVGDTVNGFTVVAVAEHTLNDRVDDVVILAYRRDRDEYVTARMGSDVDTSWYWGTYINSNRAEAWQSFVSRVSAPLPVW